MIIIYILSMVTKKGEYMTESICDQQSWNYFVSGPLEKKFADFRTGWVFGWVIYFI